MKKVLVIGAGIAGMSAGIFARRAGFETLLVEKNQHPGGECTGWDRMGCHIDGCIHWFTGTSEASPLHRLWNIVGALGGDAGIIRPEYMCEARSGGTAVRLYRDGNRLRDHLLDVAPEDAAAIDELCGMIRLAEDASGPPLKPPDLMGPLELIRLATGSGNVRKIMKAMRIPLSEYLGRFKSEPLRFALASLIPTNYSACILPLTLGSFCAGDADIPAGGSRSLSARVARTYQEAGGVLMTGRAARRIELRAGRAIGATLEDGTFLEADYVVPACNVHHTLGSLLGGGYTIPQIDRLETMGERESINTAVLVSFSVEDGPAGLPHSLAVRTRPFEFEGAEADSVCLHSYPVISPAGNAGPAALTAMLWAKYEWWKAARMDIVEYRRKKDRLAIAVADAISGAIPELAGRLKPIDVATPATFERYCNAYRGGYMSYTMTPRSGALMLDGRIRGVRGLFLAGQDVILPGGLPIALVSGAYAAQRICKAEGVEWRW